MTPCLACHEAAPLVDSRGGTLKDAVEAVVEVGGWTQVAGQTGSWRQCVWTDRS